MKREQFEQVPYLREELELLGRLPGEEIKARQIRKTLEEAETLCRQLPDSKARLVARKVMEHGAPIPWKEIVAELGYRWTVGKARYAYDRVCRYGFEGEHHRRIGG